MADYRISWPNLAEKNAALRLVVHPRRADVLVYDIRPLRPERDLPDWTKALFAAPASGFSFRIIQTPDGDSWCIRAVLTPTARQRLREVTEKEKIDVLPIDIDTVFMVADPNVLGRYKEKWRAYAIPDDGNPGRPEEGATSPGAAPEGERDDRSATGDLREAAGGLPDRGRPGAGREPVDAGRGNGAGGPDGLADAPPASSLTEDAALSSPAPESEEPAGDLFGDLFVPDTQDLQWGSFQHAARAAVNTRIVKTLEQIHLERREATPEEKRLLSQYAGWGALASVAEEDKYRRQRGGQWADPAQEAIRSALDARAAQQEGFSADEAFQALKSSILNAHYTAPAVVDAIWSLVRKSGFKGGRVLEPSAGAGIFIGRMPLPLRRRSEITAVEIEPIAADVLRTLYPEVQVIEKPLQETSLPSGYFDLVISNVPFANIPVYDARRAKTTSSLHDYFLERGIDSLRPGGIGVFLTSSYSLDKVSRGLRDRIGQKARLIGALRLPKESQSAQAGTEVVEDLLFFQALTPDMKPNAADFVDAVPAVPVQKDNRFVMVPRGKDRPAPAFDANGRPVVDEGKVADWEETRERQFRLNKYYLDHPDHILGHWAQSNYQRAYTLTAANWGDIPHLAQKIQEVGQGLAFDPVRTVQAAEAAAHHDDDFPLPPDLANHLLPDDMRIAGSLVAIPATESLPAHIGQVTRTNPDTGETFYLSLTEAASPAGKKLTGYMAVRDALRETFRTDTDEARADLNAAYDAFAAAHGRLARSQKLFADDPYAGRVLALEVVQKDKSVAKADIFHKSLRTRLPVDQLAGTITDLREALIMAVSETGRLNDRGFAVARALLTAEKAAEIGDLREAALDQEIVFLNPQTEEIETDARYLSGHLPDKLDAARAAADRDPRFRRNVSALESAMPAPLEPGDIIVDMGAHWVPAYVMNQFLRHLGNLADDSGWLPDDEPVVTYVPESGWVPTGRWVQAKGYITRQIMNANPDTGTARCPFPDLFLTILRRTPIQVFDKTDDGGSVLNRPETQAAMQAADHIREKFRAFVWDDPKRSNDLCAIYNRLFNGFRPPSYIRPHTQFEDMSPSLHAYPTQANMVMRGLTEMAGIIAHDVGMGKTLTMIIMAHEMRRLNLARRVAIIVKKSTLVQFAGSAQEAYPQARFLVMTNEHLSSPERRRDFIARATTQDFDAIILTHETFAKLDISPFAKQMIVAQELARQEEALEAMKTSDAPRYTKKQVIARIKRLEASLEAATDSERTDKITLDQDLGIDLLATDEAHLFKNSDAARSLDFQIKAEAVRRLRQREDGVFLATATPVSNSLNEIHRMISYVRPDLLERAGMTSLEAFRSSFVGTKFVWEPHHAGAGWVLRARDMLVNVPEIMAMLSCVMDRRTIDRDAKGVIVRPEKQIKTVEVPMTPLQRMVMADVARRASNPDQKGENHVFALMDTAAKASCDTRLLIGNPSLVSLLGPDFVPTREDGGKLTAVVDQVLSVYRATKDIRGAQMVFLDMGVPGGVSANLYDDLTQMLVDAGIPIDEIAAIHEATSDQARADLFDEVNAGRKRILLGSTSKMAEGVNAQERLSAIHIVNPPWRPDIVEQAIGRGVRQGNTNKQVDIFFYAAVSAKSVAGQEAVSPDAFRYQLLQTKINMFSALLSGEYSGRTFDPDTSMTMAEIAATAAGDPMVMKKFEAEAAVASAESTVRFLVNQRSRLRSSLITEDYSKDATDVREAFIDALPGLDDGPEVWFLADAEGRPVSEIGGRDDMLACMAQWRKESIAYSTRDHERRVFCRNVPMTVVSHAEDSTVIVALKSPVKNPDDTRVTVSRIRFSKAGSAVQRLLPQTLAEDRRHIAAARARREDAVKDLTAKLKTIDDIDLPAANQAEAEARKALAVIEAALSQKHDHDPEAPVDGTNSESADVDTTLDMEEPGSRPGLSQEHRRRLAQVLEYREQVRRQRGDTKPAGHHKPAREPAPPAKKIQKQASETAPRI